MAESHSKGRKVAATESANEALLAHFIKETAHDGGGSARTHASRIRAALKRHEASHGEMPSLSHAFRDPDLLARILLCDASLKGEGKILRSYVNSTRNSFSAFAAALPVGGEPSREVARATLARARELSTRQRGLRRQTIAGRGAEIDLRHVPTADEIGAVVDCLRANDEPAALLAADVVTLCYLTGLRIGAVLALRRRDLFKYPDGRRWLVVREKARNDRRPVELRGDRPGLVEDWEMLAPDGSLWQRDGIVLDHRGFARELKRACMATGVPVFSPHRLRHAFASDVAVFIGIGGVQLAGGWRGEKVAETYVHPRQGGA